jgi:hypothetical protein
VRKLSGVKHSRLFFRSISDEGKNIYRRDSFMWQIKINFAQILTEKTTENDVYKFSTKYPSSDKRAPSFTHLFASKSFLKAWIENTCLSVRKDYLSVLDQVY